MTAPSARDVATQVLFRVADKGAFAAAALDAELRRAKLDRRDAALATEIVYGALRAVPELDAALAARLTRPVSALDGLTRAALRAGAYQLLHLGRVPPHAVVDAAVAAVRRKRGPKLAGLVNAVLRKVAADRPAEPAPPRALSVPDWLAGSVRAGVGDERARAFVDARELPPPIGLRVDEGARGPVAEAIRAARPEAKVEQGRVSPRALLVRGAGDPRALPGYVDGRFAVQEQGAQAVGLLAGAAPGERVADACAGRGGKTTLMAGAVGDGGHVTAMDLYEAKLERIAPELARLHLPEARVDTVPVDLTVGTAGMDGRFDRVLVDAPCTGLGTVHRRPEILLRVGPDDPARMASVQLAILRTAARLLRPGGVLVYAVCSPTHEEGAGVVERVAAELPALRPIPGPWPLSTVAPDPDGIIRIGPWNGDCDAYQLTRWRL